MIRFKWLRGPAGTVTVTTDPEGLYVQHAEAAAIVANLRDLVVKAGARVIAQPSEAMDVLGQAHRMACEALTDQAISAWREQDGAELRPAVIGIVFELTVHFPMAALDRREFYAKVEATDRMTMADPVRADPQVIAAAASQLCRLLGEAVAAERKAKEARG